MTGMASIQHLMIFSTALIMPVGKTLTGLGKNGFSFVTKIPLSEISKIVLGNKFIPEKYDKDNVWIQK